MPCSYVQLGLEEHRRIHRLREAKVPVAEIAAAPNCHRSTIRREIARNWWHNAEVPQAEGYWPLTAQDLAARRRRAGAKLERHAELRDATPTKVGWHPPYACSTPFSLRQPSRYPFVTCQYYA